MLCAAVFTGWCFKLQLHGAKPRFRWARAWAVGVGHGPQGRGPALPSQAAVDRGKAVK